MTPLQLDDASGDRNAQEPELEEPEGLEPGPGVSNEPRPEPSAEDSVAEPDTAKSNVTTEQDAVAPGSTELVPSDRCDPDQYDEPETVGKKDTNQS